MSVSTSSQWSAGSLMDTEAQLDKSVFSGECLSASRHWKLARNCSLAPRQLLLVFVALSMLSLTVAVFFG